MNLISMGRLLQKEERYDSAVVVLQNAVRMAREMGNREQEIRGLAFLGLTQEGMGRGVGAIEELDRALELSREIGHQQLAQEVLGYLGRIHATVGDFRTALDYQLAHEALKDSLFTESSGRRIAAMETTYEARRQEQENATLLSEQETHRAVIARQRQGFFLGGGALVLAGGLLAVLYQSRQASERANRLLSETNLALARKNEEVNEALEKVRTLKGLIPICVSCKKVRDDQGFWEQVESYVSRYSEASFSHGICPDCAKAIYPELEEVGGEE